MKLATLKHSNKRDGELVVVSRDGRFMVSATQISPNLREAVENWDKVAPQLEKLSQQLEGQLRLSTAIPVDPKLFHSPLPRAFQWADGSAFLHHVKLVRMARRAEMPARLFEVPLMYQGGSDDFLAPTDDIPQIEMSHGTDFEGEIAVVTSHVPMGTPPDKCLSFIKLILLVNDVSLRGLIPEELSAGFGFFQSKPSSAFAPFALTPDELGTAWRDGRLHLPLRVEYNGEFFGRANGGEMHFHFGQLIAHAARTRNLSAGTIIGSGTVSNADPNVGSSCLAEKRMIEQINDGQIRTPFMKPGDRIRIFMQDEQGHDLFGAIDQQVVSVK